MLEHLLPVAGQMLAVNDRRLDAVFSDVIQQPLLALNLGKPTQVTVTPQEIEGVINQLVLGCPRRVQPAVPKSSFGLRGRPPPPRR
jgi:hypothetical protein